jgi:hypothetical protein
MQRSTIVIRSALLATVLAGLACARNKTSDDEVGSARDSSITSVTDTVGMSRRDTGMTDSARAVSPKAGTIDSVVDSSTSAKRGLDSSTTAKQGVDSSTTAR